jgi:DNA-binding NarL/FixJ family response regulator
MSNIIIVDQNRLLREMLSKAISADQDVKSVRILKSHHRLYEEVQKQEVDWVIISLPDDQDEVPTEIKQIWVDYPDTGVLIVSPDGSHLRVKWLEAHEQVLDGISLGELIELLLERVVLN